ncbi:MAG: PIN domain-containing protein [Betaproteobacteria bacterium]|nr:PIN domain-containing protein [Betaproteobacteria bacterium]
MSVVFDTNVVLDLLLDRAPHAAAAVDLFNRVERGELRGMLGATTLTTIHYLAAKAVGAKPAKAQIAALLALFEVAPVTRGVLDQALTNDMADFEDAVLAEAGRQAGATAIVTRNARDFRGGPLRAYTPQQWLALPVAE